MAFGWRNLKRSTKRRIVVYGGLVAVTWGVYAYQPIEIEWFPREVPASIRSVDPDSSRLFSSGAKVLVITAHPDDSEFYIGGILTRLSQAGADLHQVICTDGDKGYYLWENAAKNRETRHAEAREAAAAWHAKSLEFLGFPDGRLGASDDVVNALAKQIQALQPDYILAFDPEYPPRMRHRDHRVSGVAAVEAAKQAHTNAWLMLFATRAPNYVADISRQWDDQKKLVAIHKSQFHGKKLEMVLNFIEESASKDGDRINKGFGEGFRCVKVR